MLWLLLLFWCSLFFCNFMTDSTFTLSMYLLALLGELFSIHTFVHTHTLSSTNYSASVTSFQVIALEYSVEMTYPLPEGTSAGLLNLFGLVSTHTHLTSNSDTHSLSLSLSLYTDHICHSNSRSREATRQEDVHRSMDYNSSDYCWRLPSW